MLRALIGWICGFISGIVFLGLIINPTISNKIVSIVFIAITLGGCIFFARRHHLKKKNEYYNKLKSNY